MTLGTFEAERLWPRPARRFAWLALVALLPMVAACGDEVGPRQEDMCRLSSLPLTGTSAGAPTLTDAGLEVQTGEGIIIVATVTDPQGTSNLQGLLQSVSVFPDRLCRGAPFTLRDDIAQSGDEETFGTAIRQDTHPALVSEIAAENFWPVEVSLVDFDGNRTEGQVLARVIR